MSVDLFELAGLDAPTRAYLLDAVSALPASREPSAALSAALAVVRDALRERHPIRRDQLVVEVLCRLDTHRWAVEGWTAQPDAELTALTPEGETVRVLATAVGEAGRFEAITTPRSPSSLNGWVLISSSAAGIVETAELRATTCEQVQDGTQVIRIGPRLPSPPRTIVALLDRDGELLEHHLVWLETAPGWRDAELVCVLDGPADVERARWRAGQLHELYARPMTLVVLPMRAGRWMMRTAGTAHATAHEVRCSQWPGRLA
jgi:hypothetical protein